MLQNSAVLSAIIQICNTDNKNNDFLKYVENTKMNSSLSNQRKQRC